MMRTVFVIATLMASLALSACTHRAARTADPSEGAAVVSIARSHPANLPRRVELTGTLAARDSAVIGAEQAGRVAALLVREGDPVVHGQLLATIDDATYAAAAAAAAGSVAAAHGSTEVAHSNVRVAQASVTAARAALARAQAEVAAASAAAANARLRADRLTNLYDSGAVSRQDSDDAVAAANEAEATLAAAEAVEGAARSELARTEATADAANANVDAAGGQARVAQEQQGAAATVLAQTSVRAPFSGVVTKRWVDTGAYANLGTPIVTVESIQDLELGLSVPESDVQALPAGRSVRVSIDALGVGAMIDGRVRALIPSETPEAHTFVAKVAIARHPGLLPGMFARVRIMARPVEGTGVPASSVVQRAEQSGVFIVAGGYARFQPVTVRWTDGRTTLVDGLAVGAPVAVSAALLVDGQPVVVR